MVHCAGMAGAPPAQWVGRPDDSLSHGGNVGNAGIRAAGPRRWILSQPRPGAAMPGDGVLVVTPEEWQRAKEILEAALAQPIHERKQYVAGRCADDDVLRLEIESMLTACDDWRPVNWHSTFASFHSSMPHGPRIPWRAVHRSRCLQLAHRWVPTRSGRCSGSVAWAWSTSRATRVCTVMSRSRCFRRPSPATRTGAVASSTRRARWRR